MEIEPGGLGKEGMGRRGKTEGLLVLVLYLLLEQLGWWWYLLLKIAGRIGFGKKIKSYILAISFKYLLGIYLEISEARLGLQIQIWCLNI